MAEALQTAMRLAEALRQLHDTGKAHGAVTPASIVLSGNTVELIPTVGPLAAATPYTAPELLQGQPADARSDIFSFGALVFEMLTGRPAFEGAGQTELKLALCNATPPSSGSPAVDRLVAACVAKSPAARWQRMQKIIMELKLLTVAARRADTPAPARGAADNALRAELHQLEARVSLKFASYEKTLAGMQQTAGEAAEQLKQQLAGVHAQLVAVEQRPVVAPVDTEALMQKIQGRVQEAIAAVTQQIESHVRESVEASGQKHSAQVQEIAEQVKSAHSQQAALAEQVKQSVDAAHSEQVAHVHETVGALRQEIAEQLNGTHAQQAAHLQETVGALRQEIAEQVKQSVDAAHSQQAAHVQETVGALRQEIAEQ
ncbi:MAG TPA: protein kinase, partial [Bryobacteraceae bacterium]|nr:protein kinase [Bryobacteraceae bacterium]